MPDGKGKGGKTKGRVSPNPSPNVPKNQVQARVKVTTAPLPGVPSPDGTERVSGDAQKKRPRQCVYCATPGRCIIGKNCLYLHQNDSVAKNEAKTEIGRKGELGHHGRHLSRYSERGHCPIGAKPLHSRNVYGTCASATFSDKDRWFIKKDRIDPDKIVCV